MTPTIKPGYKQTEVGVIPEDWEVVRLGSVVDPSRHIRYGIVQPGRHEHNGCLMLRSQDYSKGWAGPVAMHRVTPALESQYKNARISDGDLIMTVVGAGIGQVVVVPNWLNGAILSRSTARIAVKTEDAAARFIRAVLEGPVGKRQILDCQKEGAQPVVSCVDLAEFLIPLPTLAEQEAIAEALGDADALIESLEQLIAKKRQLKQGAMQDLLTGKKRLPGFEGEWTVESFEQRVKHHSGDSSLIKGRLSSAPTSDYFPGFSASGQDVWLPENRQEGDALIVSAVGSRCGKCFRAKGKWSAIANTHIVWPTEKLGSLDFLMLYLNDEQFWVRGGTGQPFVKFRESFAQIIGWPDPEEQTAIATTLSDMDAELAALEAKLAKARQIKQGMMQELLTGNIRLVQELAI